MPGDERDHDTDPLADTQSSDKEAPPSTKKRAVQAGDVLGRYELGEDIGEGGMATVYRAHDRELRRDVAIKVLFPHLARRPEIVRRFHREARAAAALEHSNILTIYDVGGGESDDPPYIVMELIRGRTLLAEIEQRGPMLAEIAASIGSLLADALAAAHAAGIIHRDVKPANVLIAPGGRLLLADFGVARLETEDSLVTRTGALLGTPAYMSAEQASGDTATAKSDLYSLGVTLYQLATGTLPYTGSQAKVMSQLALGSFVTPVRRRAAVGPDLSRVIERLMAVDPSARPSSATEVAMELRAIAAQGGLGDPTAELAAYFADPDAFVRERTPGVVTALISATERAIGDSKLPRAMALAGRASALAPEDPVVAALVHKVTEGGRRWRRGRIFVIGGAGLTVAVAAVAGVMLIGGQHVPALPDRGVHPQIDAAIAVVTISIDAGSLPMIADAAAPIDATLRRADAARRIDASQLAAPIDAAAALPLVVVPDAAVAPAAGAIVVKNDTWCDVTIDSVPLGRAEHTFRVDAGRHVVVCAQPGSNRSWTREVEVAPSQTAVVSGAMLGIVDVTLAIDATIGTTVYHRGDVAHLKAGRYELAASGAKRFVDLRTACVVRAVPELDCYP